MNSYDEVPYPSLPYFRTHPDHLATIAALLGLSAPQRPYRLLELGCASGGNVIPQAAARPDCQFVGIDYSSRQIAEGQKVVESLALENIQLFAQSIVDVDTSLGQFDYIVCHGVFSWVSAEVQRSILKTCNSLLAEQGIAYISYNTQPGWRQRGALRDMMQYHVDRSPVSSPGERIVQARGLLDFLVDATDASDGSYAQMLREQQTLLARQSDSYIYHEHLEQHNEPLWFLDFCQRLAQHDLRYLGEADFSSMVASQSLSSELQERLDQLAPNLIEKEQYTDFVRNRAFRQTLVCHAQLRPNYAVRGECLRSLYAATPGRVQQAKSAADTPQEWRLESADGFSISTPLRATQLGFELLSQAWPERIAIATLVEQVAERLAVSSEDLDQVRMNLEVALLTAFSSTAGQLLELSVSPLDETCDSKRASPHAAASPLVRYQAREGGEVANRRHEHLPLMPIDRRVLPLLDGSRDIAQLLEELLTQHQAGDLRVTDEHDSPIDDLAAVAQILNQLVPQRIEFYRRQSLL